MSHADVISRRGMTGIGPVARGRSGAAGDRVFRVVVACAAGFVLASLGAIALSMLCGGIPAFRKFGFAFLYTSVWDPVHQKFGAFVPIYGTLVTSALAMLIAVPVSFGIAVFLTEVAPAWLRGPVGSAIELLAGIPSIIYGMWGLFVFAPVMGDWVEPWLSDALGDVPFVGALFNGPPLGIGMLTAGIILAIMVIPFISSVMRDVFALVPTSLREAAFGLGATRWEVVRGVVLPYTRTAVVGGIFLGLGRALGETMAVTFVLGNAHEFSTSLLMPGNSIAAAIANEFTEADSQHLPLVADRAGLRAVRRHLHRPGAGQAAAAAHGAARGHDMIFSARGLARRRRVAQRGGAGPVRRRHAVRAVLAGLDHGHHAHQRLCGAQPEAVHRDDAAAGIGRRLAQRHLRQRGDDRGRGAGRVPRSACWPARTWPNTAERASPPR